MDLWLVEHVDPLEHARRLPQVHGHAARTTAQARTRDQRAADDLLDRVQRRPLRALGDADREAGRDEVDGGVEIAVGPGARTSTSSP